MNIVLYWIDITGNLFPCLSHEEYAIQKINELYGDDWLSNQPFYAYKILEQHGWIRLKITKSKIYMYNTLREINDKQRKEIKDYSLEHNLLIKEDIKIYKIEWRNKIIDGRENKKYFKYNKKI